MKVRELMVKDVVTVATADASAQYAARIMNENGIGCLVVVDTDHVLGIITERDLLRKVVEAGRNPKEVKISEIMSENIVCGNPDMELTEATQLMFKNRVKKLPIVGEDQLVGMVTLTDIARIMSVDKETMTLIQTLQNMHRIGESSWRIGIASITRK